MVNASLITRGRLYPFLWRQRKTRPGWRPCVAELKPATKPVHCRNSGFARSKAKAVAQPGTRALQFESSIRQHAVGPTSPLPWLRLFPLLGPGHALAGAASRGLQRDIGY